MSWFYIGGPKNSEAFVRSLSVADAVIDQLAIADGFDRDDYTVTEVPDVTIDFEAKQ